MKLGILTLCALIFSTSAFAADPVTFDARTVRDGNWSDAATWADGRLPRAGDRVQVHAGHAVSYDVDSADALRMVHVAGTLTFSRDKSTLLDVGLIKVEPGETTTEDGFACHDDAPAPTPLGAAVMPTLEIGTAVLPIPPGVTATIRLRHHQGMNPETLPAIIVCGGRWEIHGAPMPRTWLKLAAPVKPGDARVTLEQSATGWRVGDRVIVTTGDARGPADGVSFRQDRARAKPVATEERLITAIDIDSATLTLDRALAKAHRAAGITRCEVANLSRNVVVESAEPKGVRGHTMYHLDSAGGISYAEFRHLGKADVLGKYPIHFHLVRETMRGSGVIGASIWDSHNRFVAIHGSDHLLIRDCVGYQSRGHGFFLEDATEQWNVLDRNLAVQTFSATPLPKQALGFDPNDGAGFWWANARNTFTRNVACENDTYGYHFELKQTPDFDPVLRLRQPEGTAALRDVRTIPFLRFDDNESHGDGLFAFRFGDEAPGSVRGDRQHPFVVRNLRAWAAHYAVRPNIRSFMLDGLRVTDSAFGIYHPDYDQHAYRDVAFDHVTGEAINGAHDEEAVPHGDVTYDRLTFDNCRPERDALVQLTTIAPRAGLTGHFRGVTFRNSKSAAGGAIDFGGGPRTNRVDHAVSYYFHDTPLPGTVIKVSSAKDPKATPSAGGARVIDGWTGPDARATEVRAISFLELLDPVDDLPPATMITRIRPDGARRIVQGVAHDNGEIATVTVNGQAAMITSRQAGVVDWTITLDAAVGKEARYTSMATDRAGNVERSPHQLTVHDFP